MAPKKNPMLAKMEAQIEAKYNALFRMKLNMLLQLGQDAGMIAAHEVLQLGPGRAQDYAIAYREAINQLCKDVYDDQKDDPSFWYAKELRDRKIKAIVGEENFAPWEECYPCT